MSIITIGRPYVKRFALCYRTVVLSVLSVCPVCLSVTLVYCGETVGRIKTKLGKQVGLGPGHIVLDGNPGPLPKKDSPQFSVHFCSGQMAPWIKMPLCRKVALDPSDIQSDEDPASPSLKSGHSPQFSAHVYCAQTAGWIMMPLGVEVGLDPSDIVLDGDPAPLPKKGQNLRPMFVVAKRLDGSRCYSSVGTMVCLGLGQHCVRCGPSSTR